MFVLCKTQPRAETEDTILYYASEDRGILEEIILSIYQEIVDMYPTMVAYDPENLQDKDRFNRIVNAYMNKFYIIEIPYLED